MAKRRMFNKDIVCSDDFMSLTINAQYLYYRLNMEADDRGYVNNTFSIMRSLGCKEADLKALIKNRFILRRNKNLYIIKGWRINNTIQPTRLVETNYADDFIKLYLDENGSYTEKPTSISCQQIVDKLSTNCQQIVDKLSTQDR